MRVPCCIERSSTPHDTSHTFTAPLTAPVASIVPSGLNASECTSPGSRWSSRPVAASHSLTTRIALAAAAWRQSGLNVTARMKCSSRGVVSAFRNRARENSQSSMDCPQSALPSQRPSGLNASVATFSRSRFSVPGSRPSARSHTLTADPLCAASQRPSGPKATAPARSVAPDSVPSAWPVEASQSRTTSSRLPSVASARQSRLMAKASTMSSPDVVHARGYRQDLFHDNTRDDEVLGPLYDHGALPGFLARPIPIVRPTPLRNPS